MDVLQEFRRAVSKRGGAAAAAAASAAAAAAARTHGARAHQLSEGCVGVAAEEEEGSSR